MCLVYYEGKNVRYFFLLIAEATTIEGYHQKKREKLVRIFEKRK